MATALRLVGGNVSIKDVGLHGFEVGLDLANCPSASLEDIDIGINSSSTNHLKLYGNKYGRNQLCPCGSGVKLKKCTGNYSMSTGIRSNNSTLTVGKATIIAETGVDLQNNSHAHIDELIHYSPTVFSALQALPVQPPLELVKEAIAQQKSTGTIERSKLKAWFDGQGMDLAFWVNLTVAIAALV
ncbi:SEC-C motif [Pseudomonas sp. 22 E 5]|nr:SEC-C motif [Pseudomonas sp. 22 E 5]